MEYAVSVLGVRDIVVCGHSNCGAMTAIASCTNLQKLPAVASWLRHADAAKAINESREHESDAHKIESMVRENVLAQLANLLTHPSVAVCVASKGLTLHAWIFHIENGTVLAYDSDTGQFRKYNLQSQLRYSGRLQIL